MSTFTMLAVSVKVKAIRKAIELASKVVPTRCHKPILQMVRIVADGPSVSIEATDLEIGVRVRVAAEADGDGMAMVGPKDLKAILKGAGPAEDVKIATDGDRVRISRDGAEHSAEAEAENPDYFPTIPAPPSVVFAVSAADTLRMFARTEYATDCESTRYALGGVCVELEDSKAGAVARAVATDGKMLAIQESACGLETDAIARWTESPGQKPQAPVLPLKACKLAMAIAKAQDPDSRVRFSRSTGAVYIAFADGTEVYCRTLEGRFPRYQDILSSQWDVSAELAAGDLATIATLPKNPAGEHFANVALIPDGRIVGETWSTEQSVLGSRTIAARVKGAARFACLDATRLAEPARAIEPKRVVILHVCDHRNPVQLTTDDGFRFVLMPIGRDERKDKSDPLPPEGRAMISRLGHDAPEHTTPEPKAIPDVAPARKARKPRPAPVKAAAMAPEAAPDTYSPIRPVAESATSTPENAGHAETAPVVEIKPLPKDFPAELADDMTGRLQSIADYREEVARMRDLDRKYGGDGRYMDAIKASRASDGYRSALLRSVRAIREFVKLGREIGEDPIAILRTLETIRTGNPPIAPAPLSPGFPESASPLSPGFPESATIVEIRDASYAVEHKPDGIDLTKLVSGEVHQCRWTPDGVADCTCPGFRFNGGCRHLCYAQSAGLIPTPAPVPTLPEPPSDPCDIRPGHPEYTIEDEHARVRAIIVGAPILVYHLPESGPGRVDTLGWVVADHVSRLVEIQRDGQHGRDDSAGLGWTASLLWDAMPAEEREIFAEWVDAIGYDPTEDFAGLPADEQWDVFAGFCITGTPVAFPTPPGSDPGPGADADSSPVTLEQFGRIVPNDWPLRVRAHLMLAGKAREFWYVEHSGKSPVFSGQGVAEKTLRRLFRQFGHLVSAEECRAAYEEQEARRAHRATEFAMAWEADHPGPGEDATIFAAPPPPRPIFSDTPRPNFFGCNIASGQDMRSHIGYNSDGREAVTLPPVLNTTTRQGVRHVVCESYHSRPVPSSDRLPALPSGDGRVRLEPDREPRHLSRDHGPLATDARARQRPGLSRRHALQAHGEQGLHEAGRPAGSGGIRRPVPTGDGVLSRARPETHEQQPAQPPVGYAAGKLGGQTPRGHGDPGIGRAVIEVDGGRHPHHPGTGPIEDDTAGDRCEVRGMPVDHRKGGQADVVEACRLDPPRFFDGAGIPLAVLQTAPVISRAPWHAIDLIGAHAMNAMPTMSGGSDEASPGPKYASPGSIVLFWHCPACRKSGPVETALPAARPEVSVRARQDHRADSPDCPGVPDVGFPAWMPEDGTPGTIRLPVSGGSPELPEDCPCPECNGTGTDGTTQTEDGEEPCPCDLCEGTGRYSPTELPEEEYDRLVAAATPSNETLRRMIRDRKPTEVTTPPDRLVEDLEGWASVMGGPRDLLPAERDDVIVALREAAEEIRRLRAEAATSLATDDQDRLLGEDGEPLVCLTQEEFDGLVGAAEATINKLDYLQALWGKEGVTDSLARQLRAAIVRAKP